MQQRLAKLGCGAMLVAVLAGCTSTADGTPTAASSDEQSTSGSATTTSEDEAKDAPRVEHPLDASRFLAQPCAVLVPAQLTTLGITTPGKPETTGAVAEQAGPMCTWIAEGPHRNYGFGFLTGNKNGLSDTYRGSWGGYFEPTTVAGYPAVFNDVVDSRDEGICNLTVGITDDLTFRIDLTADLGRESCDRAVQLAELVVATIKAGG
jgi:hypothetical protein